MSGIFGVPVDAAYHLVTALAGALTSLTGGFAVAVAIVVSTVAVRLFLLPFSYHALRGQVTQSRLAPQLQDLRRRHRRDPDRLTREVRALYRAHGTSMFAGYLPLLVQWPLLSVMYLLFRSRTINGAPSILLRHYFLTAPLGAHWLTGAGPLSTQGAIFAALLVLLTLTGYLAMRVSRRLFPSPVAAVSPAPATGAAASPAPPSPSPWLTRVTPLFTVVFAAFLPLAGVLCLLTTTAWTVLERRVLARYLPPAPRPAPAQAGPTAGRRP